MADSPPFGNDQILLRTQKIIIGGVRSFVALSHTRLFILDDEAGPVREEIPFSAIATVSAGENALREPVLSIAFTNSSGEPALKELIFVRTIGGISAQDRDRCLAFLRDHNVAVAGERTGFEKLPEPIPLAQDWVPQPFPSAAGKPALEIPRGKSPAYTIAAVIIIAAVVIGAVIFMHPFWKGAASPGQVQPPGPAGSVLGSPAPAVHTVTTAESKAPVPAATLAETPSGHVTAVATAGPVPPAVSLPSAAGVPPTGVWVRVRSPGNYTGYVGAEGYSLDVNASGERFYQIPILTGMIEGAITNQDTSGGHLEVSIFRGGSLMFARSTTVAQGVIDFHVPIPLSGGEMTPPVPTTQVVAVTTTEPPLPDSPVPPTGVWVRVFSASNFTGSIGSSGRFTEFNSTGDKFYQISISTGMVEGSIEKHDGSGNPLIAAIYRDGILVYRAATVAPEGVLDIHIPV